MEEQELWCRAWSLSYVSDEMIEIWLWRAQVLYVGDWKTEQIPQLLPQGHLQFQEHPLRSAGDLNLRVGE